MPQQPPSKGRWAATMRFFSGPAVLIIDELGCAPRGAVGSCGLRSPPPVVARSRLKLRAGRSPGWG